MCHLIEAAEPEVTPDDLCNLRAISGEDAGELDRDVAATRMHSDQIASVSHPRLHGTRTQFGHALLQPSPGILERS